MKRNLVTALFILGVVASVVILVCNCYDAYKRREKCRQMKLQVCYPCDCDTVAHPGVTYPLALDNLPKGNYTVVIDTTIRGNYLHISMSGDSNATFIDVQEADEIIIDTNGRITSISNPKVNSYHHN